MKVEAFEDQLLLTKQHSPQLAKNVNTFTNASHRDFAFFLDAEAALGPVAAGLQQLSMPQGKAVAASNLGQPWTTLDFVQDLNLPQLSPVAQKVAAVLLPSEPKAVVMLAVPEGEDVASASGAFPGRGSNSPLRHRQHHINARVSSSRTVACLDDELQ